MVALMLGDKEARLSLVLRLSERFDVWGAWKNIQSALEGDGDIDSITPREHWPVVAMEFEAWALDHGAAMVASCEHVPGIRINVAVSHEDARIFQLDLWDKCYVRGGVLFEAHEVLPLMELDDRGFRRLPVGTQGVFVVMLNGVRRGGRIDHEALRDKTALTDIDEDPEGARAAFAFFGWAGAALERTIQNLKSDIEPRRLDLLALEAWAVGRAFRHPGELATRIRYERSLNQLCPVRDALGAQRARPKDLHAWAIAIDQQDQLLTNAPGRRDPSSKMV